ncbi:PepSY domain-containing protein [Methyloterricola oryzae]|uniref:PepSY domain-containing protein n=1 Tax=Methyloterricola oryzae TaxID=1495050 RepID=UPI0005EBB307|nr:PepSY domain-containing protein [Methyloterricola oryzae]
MKSTLFWIHRWIGVLLALFMAVWFASGIVIMYTENLNESREAQLQHAEPLKPQADWLSLGEAWERSAAARKAQATAEKALLTEGKTQPTAQTGAKASASADSIVDARLLREAGQPVWLIENGPGKRFAISALDGTLRRISVEDALRTAAHWVSSEGGPAAVSYLDTIETDSTLNNQESWKPFHRIAVEDGHGTQLLISARTGEVIRASTEFERALYYTGNWIHLLRFIDVISPGESRHNVQLWLGFGATAACLTGLIIGWLRWRPGWFGKPTYSRGRTQPYRDVWWKWHFWGGLIGGTVALGWGLSGYLSTNPWQMFSNANPSRAELVQYLGSDLPQTMRDWKPGLLDESEVVELNWRRLGGEAILLAYTADGARFVHSTQGGAERFSEAALLDAAHRLYGVEKSITAAALDDYDSYYYPRRGRGTWDRPLPAARVDVADSSGSRLYVDPLDGRILVKQDQSRRVFRWAFNLLHYWDLAWLQVRPLWDAWMLTWIGLGLVLSVTSVWLAWKRLKLTFRVKRRAGTPIQVGATPLPETSAG